MEWVDLLVPLKGRPCGSSWQRRWHARWLRPCRGRCPSPRRRRSSDGRGGGQRRARTSPAEQGMLLSPSDASESPFSPPPPWVDDIEDAGRCCHSPSSPIACEVKRNRRKAPEKMMGHCKCAPHFTFNLVSTAFYSRLI